MSALRESHQRDALYAFIVANPGLHLRELERAFPMSLGSLRHHLRRLERNGRIDVEFDRRFKRFYAAGMDASLRHAAAAFQQPRLRAILATLVEAGPLRHGELGRRLGIPPSSLSVYLRRLLNLDLVRERPAPDGGFELVDRALVAEALNRFTPRLMDHLSDTALRLFEDTDRSNPA